MSLSISKLVPLFLQQNTDQRFTARQIAEWMLATYPEECAEKRRRSTATKTPLDSDSALLQQLVAEIGAQRPQIQRKLAGIKTTEGRPRRYYFTERTESAEVAAAEAPQEATRVFESVPTPRPEPSVAMGPEAGLYGLLAEYLFVELDVMSKRIDERRSRNLRGKGGNKWLHPDLTGMEILNKRWNREVQDCARAHADKSTKLWSFEVKLLLNASNVRESYFQAVRNSSWANYGYLVAAEISGRDTLPELRVLAGLHGIGLIRLDRENVSESEILIPSRERESIDWGAANRVAEENDDFLDFIRLVRQFYQTGDPRAKDWDFVPA